MQPGRLGIPHFSTRPMAARVQPTIEELLENTGLSPDLFDLRRPETFNGYISRAMEIVTSEGRLALGTLWDTDNEDKATLIRAGLMAGVAAQVLFLLKIAARTGRAPTLFLGRPEQLDTLATDLTGRTASIWETVVRPTPNLPGMSPPPRNTMEGTIPFFDREEEW